MIPPIQLRQIRDLLHLPVEILYLICSLLDVKDVVRLRRVCKQLSELASQKSIWLPAARAAVRSQLLPGLPGPIETLSAAQREEIATRLPRVLSNIQNPKPTASFRSLCLSETRLVEIGHIQLLPGGKWLLASKRTAPSNGPYNDFGIAVYDLDEQREEWGFLDTNVYAKTPLRIISLQAQSAPDGTGVMVALQLESNDYLEPSYELVIFRLTFPKGVPTFSQEARMFGLAERLDYLTLEGDLVAGATETGHLIWNWRLDTREIIFAASLANAEVILHSPHLLLMDKGTASFISYNIPTLSPYTNGEPLPEEPSKYSVPVAFPAEERGPLSDWSFVGRSTWCPLPLSGSPINLNGDGSNLAASFTCHSSMGGLRYSVFEYGGNCVPDRDPSSGPSSVGSSPTSTPSSHEVPVRYDLSPSSMLHFKDTHRYGATFCQAGDMAWIMTLTAPPKSSEPPLNLPAGFPIMKRTGPLIQKHVVSFRCKPVTSDVDVDDGIDRRDIQSPFLGEMGPVLMQFDAISGRGCWYYPNGGSFHLRIVELGGK